MNLFYQSIIRVALTFSLCWIYGFASGDTLKLCTSSDSSGYEGQKIRIFSDSSTDSEPISSTFLINLPEKNKCIDVDIGSRQNILTRSGKVRIDVGTNSGGTIDAVNTPAIQFKTLSDFDYCSINIGYNRASSIIDSILDSKITTKSSLDCTM